MTADNVMLSMMQHVHATLVPNSTGRCELGGVVHWAQQKNGTDCGVYMLGYAHCLAFARNPATSFQVKDIPTMRKNIVLGLVRIQNWTQQQAAVVRVRDPMNRI